MTVGFASSSQITTLMDMSIGRDQIQIDVELTSVLWMYSAGVVDILIGAQ